VNYGGFDGGMGGLRRRRPLGMGEPMHTLGSPLAMAAARPGRARPPQPLADPRFRGPPVGVPPDPRFRGPPAPAMPALQSTGLGQIAVARMKRKPSPYGGAF
jgi:hypothetical protein